MNKFKEGLNSRNYETNNNETKLSDTLHKFADEKIKLLVSAELERLQNQTDIREYQLQIANRKNGILNLWNNLENNIEIIKKEREKLPIQKSKVLKTEHYIDRIIIRKLIEKIYSSKYLILSLELTDDDIRKIEVLIKQRCDELSYLLEDYDNNISILDKYSETSLENIR